MMTSNLNLLLNNESSVEGSSLFIYLGQKHLELSDILEEIMNKKLVLKYFGIW